MRVIIRDEYEQRTCLDCTEMDLMAEGLLGPGLAGRVAAVAGPRRAADAMLIPL